MKTPRQLRATLTLTLLVLCAQYAPAQDTLPNYLHMELKRLEETWHILDLISMRVWPGWNNYTDVPFLFTYPNGVQMLVGHPNPPDGFSLVPGVEVRGKKVYVNRQKEVPLTLTFPLVGGGGPIPFGIVDGKPVTVVRIESRSVQVPVDKEGRVVPTELYRLGTENQILLNIHELFHCFQTPLFRSKYGNLRYNTDENYATYAEIEGLALERAYLEPNDALAKEYLKDSFVANELKQRSMNQVERLQESEEEVREGTATYAELTTLTLLKRGYQPVITQQDDPFFFDFRFVDSLIQLKIDMLRSTRANTLSSRDKSYSFGCFQATLLDRFAPGWKDGFFQSGKGLGQALDSVLALSPEEREKIAKRLKTRYNYDELHAKHARLIGERNRAFDLVQKRKGLTFIVNFKNTGEYASPESPQTSYRMGLINIYPKGIKKIKFADVLFEGEETPMVIDQLYYVKWIDTKARGLDKSYEVLGLREGKTNVYRDAVFKTRGFRLSAPKIEIKESKNRVKVTVLAKVKG
jgi:hypothetical protein